MRTDAARLRAWMVLLVLALLAGRAQAQVGGGQLTGLVLDATRAALPGATITATNVATAASRVTTSSVTGTYTLAGLAPGTYRIDVALEGFRRSGVRGFRSRQSRRSGSTSRPQSGRQAR